MEASQSQGGPFGDFKKACLPGVLVFFGLALALGA